MIMSNAVKQICDLAFEEYVIVRIFAKPFAYNIGSKEALEKAGFQLEGSLKKNIYKNIIKVIDLEEKKVIQTISILNQLIVGFDIDDGKIVWSDLSNEKDSSKIQDYMETANLIRDCDGVRMCPKTIQISICMILRIIRKRQSPVAVYRNPARRYTVAISFGRIEIMASVQANSIKG